MGGGALKKGKSEQTTPRGIPCVQCVSVSGMFALEGKKSDSRCGKQALEHIDVLCYMLYAICRRRALYLRHATGVLCKSEEANNIVYIESITYSQGHIRVLHLAREMGRGPCMNIEGTE